MTIEHLEQQLQAESPAVHFLTDTISDFLLNRGHAAKIGEITSQVGKRIGASAKLIRQTLSSNSQFVGEERRWNLSLRTYFHRPLEGALRQTLELYGKPMTIAAFSNEMAVLNARSPEFYQSMLHRFMAERPQTYFQTPDGRWGLRSWLLDLSVPEDDDVLMRSFFRTLDAARPLLDAALAVELPAELDDLEAGLTILTAVGTPLNTKVMAFALWKRAPETFDPEAFFLALLADPRFHLLSGGEWIRVEQVPALTTSLQQLSALAETVLEDEEPWEGPYSVATEDLNEIFDFLVEHGRPQQLPDVIEAVFEYSKISPRYPAVYEALMPALQADARFQLVGKHTWTLPSLIPQEMLQVPESLLPELLDPATLDDPETDAELEDEGLENELATWVHDPRYEDFGGEHEVELSPDSGTGEALEETRIPLLFNHQRMGTLKLRQADMSFFPTDTPLACITIHGEALGTFQMWINNEELLIHGLADWYQAREIPVGAVLTFRRTVESDEFALAWDGEMDPLVTIPEERIAVLLNLREQSEEHTWSNYEIMRHVLAGRPEGLHFLTLWAEVNVVRRSPKRVIASNVSSYHCFVPVTGTERWKLDERKVDQGRKKTKKKFIIE